MSTSCGPGFSTATSSMLSGVFTSCSTAAFIGFPPPLELVASQAAIHGNDRAGDVGRQWRHQQAGKVGNVFGLAITANGDLVRRLPLPVLRRIVAPDLLGHDAPRSDAVDGDTVLADIAREALGPSVQRGLGA